MGAFRGVLGLQFASWLVASSLAQGPPQHSTQAVAAPEKVVLTEVSTVDVPSLPAESVVAPLLCDADGRILLRLAMPDTGVEDPVSVSRDGKTVIRFGREKMSDIPRPVIASVFLSGSDVYVLARGSTPVGSQTGWRTPTGEIQSQPASKGGTFVARFQRDGMYAGAVRLDVPFHPLHIGVFDNGDFLVAGADRSTNEPRLAIVASNGQFRRLVELQGDVHGQESAPLGKGTDPTALPRFKGSQGVEGSLFSVVYTSQIARDGPNLLLFRPINGPVFSISPSGEVQVHRLKVEGDYKPYTIKVARDSWIVELMHHAPNGKEEEFSTYAFDSESGAALREYFFPADMGWGLACTDGDQFTFVMANSETNSLRLVTLAPLGK
jgi:hypothetical protein